MNAEFCGKEQDEKNEVHTESGKQITDKEPTDTAKLIDEMPELHDEFDRIGELRRKAVNKAHNKKRNIILLVVIIVSCMLVTAFGFLFSKYRAHKKAEEALKNMPVSSAISGEVISHTAGKNFVDLSVTDETSAKSAIKSLSALFHITDERTDFVLKQLLTIGQDTCYRFRQTVGGVSVDGGEMVLLIAKDGTPLALNGRYVKTDGLDLVATLDKGGATNAMSAYSSKLPAEYRILNGASVTDAEKIVTNKDGKTHLAYTANMSGYNENGEYTAYDIFVDADDGAGIYVSHTASFEPALTETDGALSDSSDVNKPAATPSQNGAFLSICTVNDKFNWNDKTKESAVDSISLSDIAEGYASPYISAAKATADKAYSYFKNNFGYLGLDGKNSPFFVYLNPNEYVGDKLPRERALYTDNIIMLHREDLTQGEPDFNVFMHEYAHGVMHHIAGLSGTAALTQNAVINEGLADVFGELSELQYYGSADWIHGDRNIALPDGAYLTRTHGGVQMANMDDCYYHSTVISNAAYQMYANGISADAIEELMFRTVCMMTKNSDFSNWCTLTSLHANNMKDNGILTEEQFLLLEEILTQTGIPKQTLYQS